MRNIVGLRVREARLKHVPVLTQEELANKLTRSGFDIDRIGISKIETGLRQIHDYEVVLLAQVLEVSVSWLLLGED
ncbi:MAG: helix-turn-helix transcriptional regulator [Anaerolineales bacterium]|nr:helix-turn-helix transcriptional regulator [Anaerolineales bacterium]